MAIPSSHACIFPQDLEAASLALDQELGDRFAENLALLQDIATDADAISAGLDEGQNILNLLLVNGDGTSNLKTTDDVSTQFFLQKDKQTTLEDEQYLLGFGIILFDGVLYGPGTDGNIEALRRLYMCSGRNLATVAGHLANQRPLTFHDKITIVKVPPKNKNVDSYDLAEIKNILGITYISKKDIAVTSDFSTLVLTREFLAFNQSLAQTQRQFSVIFEQVITDVFHFITIDNSSTSIQKYQNQGYSGEYLTAILSGTDYENLSTQALQNDVSTNQKDASKIISKIDFINARLDGLDTANRTDIKNGLISNISALQTAHQKTITDSLFKVTTIPSVTTLTDLKVRHSDPAIVSLMEQRPEIIALNLNSTDEELTKIINKSVNSAPPGSTVGSNKALNSPSTSSTTTSSLLTMSSYLESAKDALTQNTSLVKGFLDDARVELVKYVGVDVNNLQENQTSNGQTASEDGQPLQGQPSAGTPAGLLTELFDPGKTFQIDKREQDVYDAFVSLYELYPDSIAAPLSRIIDMITKKFMMACKATDLLIDQAKNVIFPLKKRLDAFTSQFLSLTGSGSFSSSLLKCAINFDIGLSTSLLDDLLTLLDNIGTFVSTFLGKLAKWISNLLEKLLCIPVNLINAFLGDTEIKLPSACQIPRISLGIKLSDALRRLRDACTSKHTIMKAFNKDLIKYRLIVDSAPNKIRRFNDGALCNSSEVGNFYNAAMLNLSGSALPNPLAG